MSFLDLRRLERQLGAPLVQLRFAPSPPPDLPPISPRSQVRRYLRASLVELRQDRCARVATHARVPHAGMPPPVISIGAPYAHAPERKPLLTREYLTQACHLHAISVPSPCDLPTISPRACASPRKVAPRLTQFGMCSYDASRTSANEHFPSLRNFEASRNVEGMFADCKPM